MFDSMDGQDNVLHWSSQPDVLKKKNILLHLTSRQLSKPTSHLNRVSTKKNQRIPV